MQFEALRQPAPAPGSENIGDVLASIRRLIAQDEAGAGTLSNQTLNTLPRDPVAGTGDEASQAEPAEITAEIGGLQAQPSGETLTDIRAETTVDTPVVALTDNTPAEESVGASVEIQIDTSVEAMPLILNTSDLIAPEFPDTAEDMPSAGVRLHLEPSEPVEETAAPEEMALPQDNRPWRQAGSGIDFSAYPLWADPPRIETPDPEPATDQAIEEVVSTSQTVTDLSHIAQPEEAMLQTNATVTPINSQIEAQINAELEPARDAGEPHLFAPQDKDAQKGTHLRGMIREAIRQELQGEIGTRLSRNLQQMIRHEIELTLRQMCEQE